MPYTRREVGKIALATLALPRVFRSDMLAAGSKINGVGLGAITYSFRTIPDAATIVKAMQRMGFTEVELMYNHAEQLAGAPGSRGGGGGRAGGRGGGRGRGQEEPPTPEQAAAAAARRAAEEVARRELAAWRASVPMSTFAPVKKMWADAGIEIRVLCFNMTPDMTDAEIDYAFNLAKTLGARALSSTTKVSLAKRIAPFADKHQFIIGFHGHDNTTDPDEFATPQSFSTAMSLSRYHGVNLDIGHFVAANYDPLPYITEHHDRITNLHLKDRKRNKGLTVPFGQGDVPIKDVLQLLKKNKWDIPANIEFEYDGDPLVEVPKCLRYCTDALA